MDTNFDNVVLKDVPTSMWPRLESQSLASIYLVISVLNSFGVFNCGKVVWSEEIGESDTSMKWLKVNMSSIHFVECEKILKCGKEAYIKFYFPQFGESNAEMGLVHNQRSVEMWKVALSPFRDKWTFEGVAEINIKNSFII